MEKNLQALNCQENIAVWSEQIAACRGVKTEGAIFHSNQGSQFTSQQFRRA